MDTVDIPQKYEVNTSSDEGHNTDDSTNQNIESSFTDDGTENYKMAKAVDNGNIIFDFEGNFIFPTYERDTLDWDSLSKSIGYTTEHNSDGIYTFSIMATLKRLIGVLLFCCRQR